MDITLIITFLSSAIGFSVIFLFGCLGEILTEKAGHLNLGIPGIMCAGAAGGCFGAKLYLVATAYVNSEGDLATSANGILVILFAIFFAMLFAGLVGGVYAFMTVTLRVNQNVTGLAITIFGNGFASFFLNHVVLTKFTLEGGSYNASTLLSKAGLQFFNGYPEFFNSLGWFGEIFLEHGFLTYLAIILALIFARMLHKTRIGLNLRAVGESPATADAVGINVTKYKYGFILLGSAIAGLGGLCYIMQYMGGIIGATVSTTIEGLGWLSIALVIFTLWRPNLAILGSIAFGALYILPDRLPLQGITFAQKYLLQMIPYVVTIIVLIFTSIRGRKENQGPASLGLSYFREER